MNWMKWEDEWVNMDCFCCFHVVENLGADFYEIKAVFKRTESEDSWDTDSYAISEGHKTREDAQAFLDSRMRSFIGLRLNDTNGDGGSHRQQII